MMGPKERLWGNGWDRYADNRTGLVPNGGTVDIWTAKVDVDKPTAVNAGRYEGATVLC